MHVQPNNNGVMHVHVISIRFLQEEFNLKVFGDNKRCTIFVDRVRTCYAHAMLGIFYISQPVFFSRPQIMEWININYFFLLRRG